ncbi:4-deoxy-L-threo-5-hexosulose-uronate ketol-isomerase [hydrothermal vent metagenome]|uniref:5-dehydro-4-deoxy-D-glucuronate isomerase n=1 Tax=hydrothermal vent metagenome TaxID=652676 RepID=A0A3B0TWS0_9ZZZZ
MVIDIRQVCSPTETKSFDTGQLRANYLITDIFRAGEITMTYSHLDRTIVGGAMPGTTALKLLSNKQIGTKDFLERREIGIINVGGSGKITIENQDSDLQEYELENSDCLYIPMKAGQVQFHSIDANSPAKFYFISSPAHRAYKVQKITADDANLLELGTQADANVRVLRQYIHPEICDSCQLVMGVTMIADGSVWNTMPAHIHDRRSEVYLYFNMEENTRVFHMMGDPNETRHIVVSNEQAILSPGWSIHSGAGTGNYGFIWSMAGDNQDFTDMDFIKMEDLR